MSLSPASGSVLTAQSLEPASDSMSPFLFYIYLLACTLENGRVSLDFLKYREIYSQKFLRRKREVIAHMESSVSSWSGCLQSIIINCAFVAGDGLSMLNIRILGRLGGTVG